MPNPPAVETVRRGPVLLITINRPDARNAIDGNVAHGIAAAVDELDADDRLRAAVLTGAGGTFCSGMDLKAFLAGDVPTLEGRGLGGITERPPRKPLLAAVEGWALAGGFELMLACDLVIAGQTAWFGLPEVKRGLVAGAGGAMLLARRIPLAVALELLMTGDPIEASRAERLGLVNRVVPAGEAVETAVGIAGTIADNGPLAVAVSKEVARRSLDWTTEEGWARQAELLAPVFGSDDAQEGARAFAERRPPVWKGR